MSLNETTPSRPLLRMLELAITNFRTFRERTVIPFAGPDGVADTIAVFHGDNGSGKSNALAALDFFFLGAAVSLRERNDEGDVLLLWNHQHFINGSSPITPAFGDRPHGSEGPMVIEVRFLDSRLGRLRLVCTPSGGQVRIQIWRSLENAAFSPIPLAERDQLFTWLVTPRGFNTQPIAIVDARRGQPRFALTGTAESSLMPSRLAEHLFALRTSRSPNDRILWRRFVELLNRFGAFKGKEVTIDPAAPRPPPSEGFGEDTPDPGYEIVVEERGRAVLGLNELSSGEQHIIVLCASSLVARAGILAIQEPEISLDSKNQTILQEILTELSSQGFLDQIILESHVPLFDGPSVILFYRDDAGPTRVARQPSRDESVRKLEEKAKEQGAKQRWVTRGGFTQLPDAMVDELSVREGGHVWFLKGKDHWEAWPEAEVDDLFSAEEPNHG